MNILLPPVSTAFYQRAADKLGHVPRTLNMNIRKILLARLHGSCQLL
jgi:hypothetical protein